MKIVSLLKQKGIKVKTFDPFIKKESNANSAAEAIAGADCVVLATHHKALIEFLSPARLEKSGVKAIVDARNALDRDGIRGKGILFKGIGR